MLTGLEDAGLENKTCFSSSSSSTPVVFYTGSFIYTIQSRATGVEKGRCRRGLIHRPLPHQLATPHAMEAGVEEEDLFYTGSLVYTSNTGVDDELPV